MDGCRNTFPVCRLHNLNVKLPALRTWRAGLLRVSGGKSYNGSYAGFSGGLRCLPIFFKYLKKKKAYIIAAGVVAALGILFAWRITDSTVVTFILLFITGFCGNGISPIITAMPVQDSGIGTKLGGTAGGFVATIQLGGSVIIPSYVIAPISQRADGSPNFVIMFSLFAVMIVLFVILCMFLPWNKAKNN